MPVIEPFTDIVKALREFRHLLSEITADFSSAMDRRQKERIRSSLRQLRFGPRGMLGTLKQAVDTGNIDEIHQLGGQFSASEARVRAAVERLNDAVRKYKLDDYSKTRLLEDLLYGKVGKNGLRRRIERLISMVNLEDFDEAELLGSLSEIVDEIEEFNSALESFHDTIATN